MPAPVPTGPLVTRGSLTARLGALGVRPGEILLAHSSPNPSAGSTAALPPWSGRSWTCSARTAHWSCPRRPAASPTLRCGRPRRCRTSGGTRDRLPAGRAQSASEGFDELGHDVERDRPVVRGTVRAAGARLFPLADAVACAEGRLRTHRPREEEFQHPTA